MLHEARMIRSTIGQGGNISVLTRITLGRMIGLKPRHIPLARCPFVFLSVGVCVGASGCAGDTSEHLAYAPSKPDTTYRATAVWQQGGSWTVARNPDWVRGAVPGGYPDDVRFASIVGADALPGGGLVVADRVTGEVTFLDAHGNLLGRGAQFGFGAGRPLERVFSCDGNRAWVRHREELVALDYSGAEVSRTSSSRGYEVVDVTADCDGFLALARDRSSLLAGERAARTAMLVWTDSMVERQRTIAEIKIGDEHGRNVNSQTVALGMPWTGQRVNLGVSGASAVAGFGDRAELRIFDREGALRRVIRWNPVLAPVTSTDRRRYEMERLILLDSVAAHGDAPGFEDAFPPLAEIEGVPAHKPVFDGLLIASDGAIWLRSFPPDALGPIDRYVERSDSVPEVWTIILPTGEWFGEIEMPPNFSLLSATETRVFGAIDDKATYPRVGAYSLHRR